MEKKRKKIKIIDIVHIHSDNYDFIFPYIMKSSASIYLRKKIDHSYKTVPTVRSLFY